MKMFVAGIDIGSLTAKTVVLDRGCHVMGQSILPTGANSEKAGKDSFQNALNRAGLQSGDIDYIIGTGYGRKNIPFADGVFTRKVPFGEGAVDDGHVSCVRSILLCEVPSPE